MYEREARAKVIVLVAAVVLIVALAAGVGYVNSLNPEDVTGEVLDKEQQTSTYVHSDKDFFFVSSSTTYQVKLLKYDDETEETFITNASTYNGLRAGQTYTLRASGVKSLGRVAYGK